MQIAKRWGAVFLAMSLVQETLDFHALLADAVRFVPVYLGTPHLAIGKANQGDPLQLPPTLAAVLPLQGVQLADRDVDRDGFDGGDLPHDLEVHERPFP